MHLARYGAMLVSTPLLVATLSCATHGATMTQTSPAAVSRQRPSGRSDVLGPDELRKAPGSNALEVIQELRPLFLRRRGEQRGPTVFVDNSRRGGTETLRDIPAFNIVEIRYLDAVTATQAVSYTHLTLPTNREV